MRLTLRTMLAYMDDVLEPDDRADIGAKIEESEFARDLVHRIRDVVRRLRLGAPQLTGRGMGLDANTVAEYLDSTLPPERVGDFEKVCLESDVHLAEVAATHQILTLVLGGPAEVNPQSRQRIYAIPGSIAQADEGSAEAEPVIAAATATESASPDATSSGEPHSPRRKPEVPEYLRKAKQFTRRRNLAIAAVLLVALGGFALWGFATQPTWLAFIFGEKPPVPEHVENEDPAHEPPTVDLGEPVETIGGTTEGGDNGDTDGSSSEVIDGGGDAPKFVPGDLPPSEDGDAPDPADVVTVPPVGPTDDGEVAVVAPMPDEAPIPSVPADQPDPLDIAKGLIDDPDDPMTDEPQDDPEEPMAEPPPQERPRVGINTAAKEVLLRYQADGDSWYRVASQAPLASGDQILALPTYRPALTLTSGLTVQLGGGTRVKVEQDDEGVPELDVSYGRLVIASPGRGGKIKLLVGEKEHTVAFGDAPGSLAVEVRRALRDGVDPQSGEAATLADFYVANGAVLYGQGVAEGREIQSPAHWRKDVGIERPIPASADLPEWIDSEPISAIDRRASISLEPELKGDRPAGLSLVEMMDQRRSEVRSLAARGALHVGQFEPFVQALSDEDQRGIWDVQIETLRQSLALGPEVASEVQKAFRRKKGDDGDALYRMLWSYDSDQLEKGAAKQLVEYLEHDLLVFRVLAFWNLREITGMGLNYRPEYSATRRAQSVRRWEEKLDSGEIAPMPMQPDDPLLEGV